MIRLSDLFGPLFLEKASWLSFPISWAKEGRSFIPKKMVGSISILEPEFFHGRKIVYTYRINYYSIYNQGSNDV
jgi:hypothetical protein